MTVTINTDAGTDSGSQTIKFEEKTGLGEETCELVKRVVYFRADAFALQHFNGLTGVVARKYSGAWILVPPSNSAFSGLAAGLTVSSISSELNTPSPRLLSGEQKLDGTQVKVLQSIVTEDSVKETIKLLVKANGQPFPIEQTVSSSVSPSAMSLSPLNRATRVVAPEESISIGLI